MRWYIVLLLICYVSCLCPPTTFTCNDGSCIPEDWVGDGEADCDDRSDEIGKNINGTNKEDDPFDDIVTQGTLEAEQKDEQHPEEQFRAPMAKPLKTKAPDATTTTEAAVVVEEVASDGECPYEHQSRVDECSEPLLHFLHDINGVYFENSSLLADKELQGRVEKGCDLMHEYSICIQGASSACKPEEGVIIWREVEMYVCQLLLPSVREHNVCFGKGRHSECQIRMHPMASPFCRLVTSVQEDLKCIKQYGECSSEAAEMLDPILEESGHVVEAIKCPAMLPASVSAVPSSSFAAPPPPAVAAPSSAVTPRLVTIPKRPTSTTTGAVVESESEDDDQEEKEEIFDDKGTFDDNTEETTTKTQATPEEEKETTVSHKPIAAHPTVETSSIPMGTKNLTIDMADAVNSLYYIYDICDSDYSKSHFAEVAKKLCEKQDEIAKYSDCFQSTLEKNKCETKEAKSVCDALESFNTNLDCAIVIMNDICEVDAQNMIVELQESINDIIIQHKCFNQEDEAKKEEETKDDGEFHLKTKLPRCTDEQENGALACLVELLEINKQLAEFQNLNFLLEMASENSTVVSNICTMFDKYEKCLDASVFKDKKRCSFASPLNTLARIGLAPICSLEARPLLASHRDCLTRLAVNSGPAQNCQSGLSGLGNTVNNMLQGIHAEALLCKSFYLIRDTFTCGEQAVNATCDNQALVDLGTLKAQMSIFGEEEGCPLEQPANLDEIIARPVKRPAPVLLPARPTAPIARPLAPPPPPPAQATPSPICLPHHQKKFEECVHPLTAFQPHPLSVIKMPRQIEEACKQFAIFKECVSDVDCHPLWAKGMTAMFEYACGEGSEVYNKIRQCLRQSSSEDVVRDCVSNFSRGAPTQACLSANKLLSCSLAPIQTSCGVEASEWVAKYVTKFATAIDSRCKLASQLPIGKVVGVGCSVEEEAIVEHCAAPLNDIGSRLEELFQGGLQNMIKNINSLAPVFAGGCNLTQEFRTCASFLLTGRSPCVVSSCLIQAGQGICDQPDPTKAIDDNLSCVFDQIKDPKFAKCIRSTLTTVKQFTLNSFRNILPRFIDCTEDIVKEKCGEKPIQVLRALSSPDLCPVGQPPIIPINAPIRVVPEIQTCTEERRNSFEQCTRPFYSRYRMIPISLLNEIDNMDQVCSDVSIMDACSAHSRVCFTVEQNSLRRMIQQICSTRIAFDQHKICLKTIATGVNGTSCMSEFISAGPSDRCTALQSTINCIAPQIFTSCGSNALFYSIAAMSDFAKMQDINCKITSPTLPAPTVVSSSPSTTIETTETMIDTPEETNILDEESRDSQPQTVVRDETTPVIQPVPQPAPTTPIEQITTTTQQITTHPKDITTTTPIKGSSSSAILLNVILVLIVSLRLL